MPVFEPKLLQWGPFRITENTDMTTLTMELPESVLAALRHSPVDISAELRLAATAT
jgi:hypothetical protein